MSSSGFFFFPFQNFDMGNVVNFSNMFAKLVKFTVGNKKIPNCLGQRKAKKIQNVFLLIFTCLP